MGLLTGLKAIKEATERKTQSEREDVMFLKLQDGDQVTLRIVGEADTDSPNYDPDRGVSGIFEIHQSPLNWKRTAACTMADDGRCFACEQNAAGHDGWFKRKKFYANVIVDDGKNRPYVAVWSFSPTARSTIWPLIYDTLVETGSITNLEWKLKRSGKGKDDTSYILRPGSPDAKPHKWPTDLHYFDINHVPLEIPYDKQAKFYGVADEDSLSRPTTSQSIDW